MFATGGEVFCKEGYNYHVYRTLGESPFVVTKAGYVSLLIIGGGGSPQASWAGGGGAGGYRYFHNLWVDIGTYTAFVGSGGILGSSLSGQYSYFIGELINYIAAGGGFGAGGTGNPAGNGGSGGGTLWESQYGHGNVPATSPLPQGCDGGWGTDVGFGGGGGYKGKGGNGHQDTPLLGWGGDGGNGILCPLLAEIWPNDSTKYCVCGGGGGGGVGQILEGYITYFGNAAYVPDLKGMYQMCSGKDRFGGGGMASDIPYIGVGGRVGGNGIVVIKYNPNDPFLNIKKNISSSSYMRDNGNYTIQGRGVTKTIQLANFTDDESAVTMGKEVLRKESYPGATISLLVNRNTFRLEVGDCFKFSYVKYGITNMIFRVVQLQEEGPESEKIKVIAEQDTHSVNSAITDYTTPLIYPKRREPNSIDEFDHVKILELPYEFIKERGSNPYLGISALACRKNRSDLGFYLNFGFTEEDMNSMYKYQKLNPYGELVESYSSDTKTIDENGFVVDMLEDPSLVQTADWSNVLSGNGTCNMAVLGDEIISFKDVAIVSGESFHNNRYQLSNVIRGRFGTEKAYHSSGESLYIVPDKSYLNKYNNPIFTPELSCFFKFVPYNIKKVGTVDDATAVPYTFTGDSLNPYKPVNLSANGSSFAARYSGEIILKWSPRYRGMGAGIGIPGEVLSSSFKEGLFCMRVYSGETLLRSVWNIATNTWTYTSEMIKDDNGAFRPDFTFKLTNYISLHYALHESAQVELVCKKGTYAPRVTYQPPAITADLLSEDGLDLGEWSNSCPVSESGGEVTITPSGTGGSMYRTIDTPPSSFSIKVKLKFPVLGTLGDNQYALLSYKASNYPSIDNGWLFQVMFDRLGVYIVNRTGTIIPPISLCVSKVGPDDLVLCNASAAYQTWEFRVSRVDGDNYATVEVIMNDISYGTVNCNMDGLTASDDGLLQIGGYDCQIVTNYIKMGTGLGPIL
jgi:hypothetical protein